MRKFTVIRGSTDSKINRAVLGLISDILFDQLLDHLDHFREVFRVRRSRKMLRTLDSQRFKIFKKAAFEFRSKVEKRNAGFAAAPNRFVVHIGEIHYPLNFEAPCFQMPMQKVLKNISAEIADMRVRINGRSACVELNLRRSDRGELFYLAAIGVVELDGHRALSWNSDPAICIKCG